MTSTHYSRSAMAALHGGLALTLVALLIPYVDRATGNSLVAQIRAGYPSLEPSSIEAAARTYLIYLTVLSVLGILGWLGVIWAVSAGKSWARWVATSLFVVGTSIALFNLTVKDTSGDTGLPPLLGWAGVLPCAAGLVAVAFLWKGKRRA